MPVRDGLPGHGADDILRAETCGGPKDRSHEGQDRLADEQFGEGEALFLRRANDKRRISFGDLIRNGAQTGAFVGTEHPGHEHAAVAVKAIKNVAGRSFRERGGGAPVEAVGVVLGMAGKER